MDAEHLPHEPAPPEERHVFPPTALLLRGAALGFLAVALAWSAIALAGKSWLFLPLCAALGFGGTLSAWGSAVHLTGGVKHDDHPFL
ncbi:MAG TPA: hypothetical protein PJ994_13655 [Tepidiformaceae bacterium]|nr:hypothetical protein [Tepidiformaceae bacterium]HMO95024.1 hypothetical protein [Tepidiformaceae bacterium]